MIDVARLSLLVPALLRDGPSTAPFSMTFSKDGPVEEAPLVVLMGNMPVVALLPLPAWNTHIGPQAVAVETLVRDNATVDAVMAFFESRIAALEAEQVAA